ncbi:hypothetical protein NKH18_17710 [Streptomyces sp. M10(2022)]
MLVVLIASLLAVASAISIVSFRTGEAAPPSDGPPARASTWDNGSRTSPRRRSPTATTSRPCPNSARPSPGASGSHRRPALRGRP